MTAITGPSHKQVLRLVNELDALPPSESRQLQIVTHVNPQEGFANGESNPSSRTFVGTVFRYSCVRTSYKEGMDSGRLEFDGIQTDPYDIGLCLKPRRLIFFTKEFDKPEYTDFNLRLDFVDMAHDGWIADLRRVTPITQQVHEALAGVPLVLQQIVLDYLANEVEYASAIPPEQPKTKSPACLQSVVRCAKSVCECLKVISIG